MGREILKNYAFFQGCWHTIQLGFLLYLMLGEHELEKKMSNEALKVLEVKTWVGIFLVMLGIISSNCLLNSASTALLVNQRMYLLKVWMIVAGINALMMTIHLIIFAVNVFDKTSSVITIIALALGFVFAFSHKSSLQKEFVLNTPPALPV